MQPMALPSFMESLCSVSERADHAVVKSTRALPGEGKKKKPSRARRSNVTHLTFDTQAFQALAIHWTFPPDSCNNIDLSHQQTNDEGMLMIYVVANGAEGMNGSCGLST